MSCGSILDVYLGGSKLGLVDSPDVRIGELCVAWRVFWVDMPRTAYVLGGKNVAGRPWGAREPAATERDSRPRRDRARQSDRRARAR